MLTKAIGLAGGVPGRLAVIKAGLENAGGADAFSAFTSVIRTLARNGGDHSLVNGLCGVFSGAPVPPLPSEPLLALRSANQLPSQHHEHHFA